MTQEQRRRSDPKESGMVQRVRKSVRALPFNVPHVVLACSAGKDSVALAAILAELHRLELIRLSIAHIHHGQHDRADEAADAVREIGRALGVSVEIRTLKHDAIDSHSGVGREEALRRERYLALAAIASESQADCIAIAHHESDQAESVLLHLMRGSGLDGLAGMRGWEVRAIPWWTTQGNITEIGIWRPLLHERAEDVLQSCIDSGLKVVEDPTNIDTSFRRNAIRQELLPVMERIALGSVGSIARTADLVGDDARYLETVAQEELNRVLDDHSLIRDRLATLPGPIQSRIVRAWILRSHPHLELSRERIVAVVQMAISNRGGACVELSSGVSIELRNGRLELNPWQNRGE